MSKTLIFLYGIICYAVFFPTIVYMIGFTGGYFVPRHVDNGIASPMSEAFLINILLLLAFGVHHTIAARPGFKAAFTKIISPAAERSTYVLVSSFLLILLFWQWRPIEALVWDVTNPRASMALVGLFALGWVVVFASTFMINHFDLFGLRQVFVHVRGRAYEPLPFVKRFMYKVVRHPLMLGFLIVLWAVPTMTLGHLIMSVGFSAYIFIALRYEERDLEAALGEDYRRYKDEVPMVIPIPKRK
jgi:protein-S-isoprenylcysteine O-methyltransferase Ste14